jgi:hypothetical protein
VSDLRAPVQSDATAHLPLSHSARKAGAKPAGTVAWEEHVAAHAAYARRYRNDQTALRIAERGGLSYAELTDFLGHEPKTWEPRR